MLSETDSEKWVHAAEELGQAWRRVDLEGRKINSMARANRERLDELAKAFAALGGAVRKDFSSALLEGIRGGNDLAAAFDKIRNSLENFAIKFAILNPLENILFGANNASMGDIRGRGDVFPLPGRGGLFGDILNGLADFIGLRAYGGPVAPGRPYIVGEKGPELFVPSAAGRVAPNVPGSMGAAPINITMNISAQDAASFRASQTQIAAAMLDAARRAQRIR